MSLMALGVKINALQKGIKEGRFTTKAQVKEAAKELRVASAIGYGNLSPEDNERWYEQLAVNLFENHNNWIPCFIDIGFGRELIDHSANVRNNTIPKKQQWKIIVTRDKFPEWQFCAIVATFCREEAVLYLKKYFSDYGDLDFTYHEPSEIKQRMPWVEVSTKKTGSYKEQKVKYDLAVPCSPKSAGEKYPMWITIPYLQKEHPPAHAHLYTADLKFITKFEITENPPVDMSDLKVMPNCKKLPQRYCELLLEWAKDSQNGVSNWDKLKSNWQDFMDAAQAGLFE